MSDIFVVVICILCLLLLSLMLFSFRDNAVESFRVGHAGAYISGFINFAEIVILVSDVVVLVRSILVGTG